MFLLARKEGMMTYKQYGFSLIEMMVVVTILAILVAIALPLYQRYVENTNLRNAQSALINVANRVKVQTTRNPALISTLTGVAVSGNAITFQFSTTTNNIVANVDGSVTQHYDLSGSKIELEQGFTATDGVTSGKANTVMGFRLKAVPKASSSFTKAAWMDSSGKVYTCETAAAADAFNTSGACELLAK